MSPQTLRPRSCGGYILSERIDHAEAVELLAVLLVFR